MRSIRYTAAMLVLVAAACSESGGGGTGIDATGTVAALAWLDRNGNEELDAADVPVEDVRVELRRRGGSTVVRSGTTDDDGSLYIENVPVGDYLASIDATTVGDTIELLRIDSADVRVRSADTALVVVALTWPSVTLAESRTLTAETRVFAEGVVLNAWVAFGDSTVHLRDASGALRTVRTTAVPVAAGDSVRVLGTTSTRAGQTVLKDVAFHLLRTGTESPPPVDVSTDDAATAQNGVLDADLVRITGAAIEDTARTTAGDYRLTVNDGSGPVVVLLDAQVGFSLNFGPGAIIGRRVDATGLLVPDEQASGRWVLKPRTRTELTVLPPDSGSE